METYARIHGDGVRYLDDGRIGEGVQQDVHVFSHLQGVNEVVMETGGDLHETCDTQESPVRVVLYNR